MGTLSTRGDPCSGCEAHVARAMGPQKPQNCCCLYFSVAPEKFRRFDLFLSSRCLAGNRIWLVPPPSMCGSFVVCFASPHPASLLSPPTQSPTRRPMTGPLLSASVTVLPVHFLASPQPLTNYGCHAHPRLSCTPLTRVALGHVSFFGSLSPPPRQSQPEFMLQGGRVRPGTSQ